MSSLRRLVGLNGLSFRGKNGSYIMIRINKTSKRISPVYSPNWTLEAREAYNQKYPTKIYPSNIRVNCTRTSSASTLVYENPEEEEDSCCICCDELPTARTTLNCGHVFCTGCILKWFQQKNNCPVCRSRV